MVLVGFYEEEGRSSEMEGESGMWRVRSKDDRGKGIVCVETSVDEIKKRLRFDER